MDRLARAARHVSAPSPYSFVKNAALGSDCGAVTDPSVPVPLSDAQVRHFCAHNFIVLQPSTLSPGVHRQVFEQLETLHEAGDGIPGNSAIMEAVPALQRIYDDPTIRGGIESLVGPDAMMHYHRHCHRREAVPGVSKGGQNWHKDDYYYEAPVRHKAAFRWIFALYYPCDTTLQMGPTSILPGYAGYCVLSSCDPDHAVEAEKPFVVPAGSVALVHFDSWHRAMPIHEGVRHMLKFHFVRMVEPCITGPTWDTGGARVDTSLLEGSEQHDTNEGGWRNSEASVATYEWLCGRDVVHELPRARATAAGENDESLELLETLKNGGEADRVAAILAAGQAAAGASYLGSTLITDSLMDWLYSADGGQSAAQQILEAGGVFSTAEQEGATRRAKACNPAGTNPADLDVTHALAAAGSAAVPSLLRALQQHEEAAGCEEASDTVPWTVACSAAAVLGNANALSACDVNGTASQHPPQSLAREVCQALARSATGHMHRWVRRNAVESLGTVGQLVSDCGTQVLVASALVAAIASGANVPMHNEVSCNEEEPADEYDTEATVRITAVLSIARLAKVWSCHGRRSGTAGLEALVSKRQVLAEIVAGNDLDSRRGHRLSGTMRDYARHALMQLERVSV